MILDTNFLIDLMRNDERAAAKLHDLIDRGEPQLITSLTVFELFSGLVRSHKPAAEKARVMKILKCQIVLHLDSDAAEKAGEIDGLLKKEGKTISPIDSLIAGIALVKKERILTRNVKDFNKIKGIEIETY